MSTTLLDCVSTQNDCRKRIRRGKVLPNRNCTRHNALSLVRARQGDLCNCCDWRIVTHLADRSRQFFVFLVFLFFKMRTHSEFLTKHGTRHPSACTRSGSTITAEAPRDTTRAIPSPPIGSEGASDRHGRKHHDFPGKSRWNVLIHAVSQVSHDTPVTAVA